MQNSWKVGFTFFVSLPSTTHILDIYIRWSRPDYNIAELASSQSHSEHRRGLSNQLFQEVSDFLNGRLGHFFHQDGVDREDAMKALIQEAASRAEQVTEAFNLNKEFTPGLIKLSFYDFVILCGECPYQTPTPHTQRNKTPEKKLFALVVHL